VVISKKIVPDSFKPAAFMHILLNFNHWIVRFSGL
jgi:hypothetical protein